MGFNKSHLSELRYKKSRLLMRVGTALAVVFVLSLGILYVFQRTQVVAVGYQIEALKKEKEAIRKENDGLKIEVATLTSPGRIEAIAATEIGMRSPEDSRVIVVRRVKRIGSARPDPASRAGKLAPTPGKT